MQPDADAFITALHALEQSRELDPIVALFSKDAAISNPMVTQGGKDGIAAFWQAYRSAFDDIASSFQTIMQTENRIALEWKSTGSIKGRDLAYEGVSILETSEDGITAFRTYFDSASLGPEFSRAANG